MQAQTWMHAFTIAPGAGGLALCKAGTEPATLLPALWLFGLSGLIGLGLEWRMYEDRRQERLIFERAYMQPTVEEKNMIRAQYAKEMDGKKQVNVNVNGESRSTYIQKAPEVVKAKKEAPAEFTEYQFVTTTPTLDDTHVRRCIKRICQRQLHQRAQYPEGDYREKSWLRTFGGPFSRDEYIVSRDILEFSKGIAKKGSAAKSSYVTIDWEVIETGARGGDLPHPNNCKCTVCQP